MRKASVVVLVAGLFVGSYATDARIMSMGKHDAFFMDEHRIFTNPAVVSLYPNMLYGSLGNLKNSDSSLILHDPFFGAIVTYSLNENVESKGKYPMLSVGAFFNRYDNILDYVTEGKEKYLDTSAYIEPPVGKVDAVLGYVNQSGVMMGVGAYIAVQSKSVGESRYETKIMKGNVGLN
ncbi:MAG: hypothetical protein N2053_10420, partial [Chitinispirillaceae bacterium]|nr:hypothetical protein [Chitinispirillaceae bacterium]